jgi:hypothetical protein
MLAGNIFACNNYDLPFKDPSADFYRSYELYGSFYTQLSFIGSFIFIGIVIRMFANRYQTLFSLLIIPSIDQWSAAASILFDKTKNNTDIDISQAWITRYQLLPETMSFLLLNRLASQALLHVGLSLFCIAFPTYIGLHPVSSIVTYDYG